MIRKCRLVAAAVVIHHVLTGPIISSVSVAAFLVLPTNTRQWNWPPSLLPQTALLAASKKGKESKTHLKSDDEERRLRRMQRELELKLREQLDNANAKSSGVAKTVRKLLRTAQHDGLADIGDEARVLAVRSLSAAGRLVDAVPILADLETSVSFSFVRDLDVARVGLRANAEAGSWGAAARFANIIFADSEVSDDDDGVDDDDANDEVRSLAIRAYGNTARNLDVAVELLRREAAATAGKVTPLATNAILGALVDSGQYDTARGVYHLYTHDNNGNYEENRLALSIASELNDVQLAEEAFGKLRNVRKLTPRDIANAMKAFCGISCHTVPIETDLVFGKAILEEFVKLGSRNACSGEANNRLARDFFSLLLTKLEDDASIIGVFEASKLVNGPTTWLNWLSGEARIKAIPILEQQPEHQDDAIRLMESLALDPKSISLSAGKSNMFWCAVLRLCVEGGIITLVNLDLARAILLDGRIEVAKDEYTVLASFEVFLALCECSRISAQDALNEVNAIVGRFEGNMVSLGYVVNSARCAMKLMGFGGSAENINAFYTESVTKIAELPDKQPSYLLLEGRYFALLKAHAVKGEMNEVYSMLFPNEMMHASKAGKVLQKGLDSLLSKFSTSSASPEERVMLQTVTEQAIACDTISGATEYKDLFLQEYHISVAERWRYIQGVTGWLSYEFPASDFIKAGTIEDDLWGATCRQVIIDLLKEQTWQESDCIVGWVAQADADPFLCGLCIAALYTSPVFQHEEMKDQHISIRKHCIIYIVNILFDHHFDQMGGTPTDSKKRVDLDTWVQSACLVLEGILQGASANKEFCLVTDYKDELFSVARRALLDQPVVKYVDDDKLNQLMRAGFR